MCKNFVPRDATLKTGWLFVPECYFLCGCMDIACRKSLILTGNKYKNLFLQFIMEENLLESNNLTKLYCLLLKSTQLVRLENLKFPSQEIYLKQRFPTGSGRKKNVLVFSPVTKIQREKTNYIPIQVGNFKLTNDKTHLLLALR